MRERVCFYSYIRLHDERMFPFPQLCDAAVTAYEKKKITIR